MWTLHQYIGKCRMPALALQKIFWEQYGCLSAVHQKEMVTGPQGDERLAFYEPAFHPYSTDKHKTKPFVWPYASGVGCAASTD